VSIGTPLFDTLVSKKGVPIDTERFEKVKNNIRGKIKEEKAAVTLLVFVTVLTFVAILMGAYLTVTTLRKSQLESDIRIQEIYGKDVNRVDEIYQELVSIDKEKPACKIDYSILDDESISYEFRFSESIKEFAVEDIKIYDASSVDTGFEDTLILSTSWPAYATTLTQNKTYAISFDYQCVSDSQEFEIGFYSETETNLPTKKFTATTETQHEEYRIEVTSAEAEFKILAQIQESNNVTLSNLQIVEIQESEAEKGALVKQDNKTYTLTAPYSSTAKYVVILEEGVCTDINENNNEETIKII